MSCRGVLRAQVTWGPAEASQYHRSGECGRGILSSRSPRGPLGVLPVDQVTGRGSAASGALTEAEVIRRPAGALKVALVTGGPFRALTVSLGSCRGIHRSTGQRASCWSAHSSTRSQGILLDHLQYDNVTGDPAGSLTVSLGHLGPAGAFTEAQVKGRPAGALTVAQDHRASCWITYSMTRSQGILLGHSQYHLGPARAFTDRDKTYT